MTENNTEMTAKAEALEAAEAARLWAIALPAPSAEEEEASVAWANMIFALAEADTEDS